MPENLFYYNWPIIHQLIVAFQHVMGLFVRIVPFHSVGLAILLFTIVAHIVLIPFNYLSWRKQVMRVAHNRIIHIYQEKYEGLERTPDVQAAIKADNRYIDKTYHSPKWAGFVGGLVRIIILICMYPSISYMDSIPYVQSMTESARITANSFLGFDITQPTGFNLNASLIIPFGVFFVQFLLPLIVESARNKKPFVQLFKSNIPGNILRLVMASVFSCLAASYHATIGWYWICECVIDEVYSILFYKLMHKQVDRMINPRVQKERAAVDVYLAQHPEIPVHCWGTDGVIEAQFEEKETVELSDSQSSVREPHFGSEVTNE